MSRTERDHVETLGRHGATIGTAKGKITLSGAFYDSIVQFCEKYGINCLGYEMTIPETDEPMMIAIWRNGDVASGSRERVQAIMDQA